MQEVFKNIMEQLEEYRNGFTEDVYEELKDDPDNARANNIIDGFDGAIDIVKMEAEKFAPDTNVGSNGWIPCSERLPEEAFGCLVTVMDCEPSTQTDFENILPYFVGYDGETWNDADGEEIPFEVIAWRELPSPYQPKGE